MRGFKIVPPPQRFMTLAEIHNRFGTQGVVAYSCRLDDDIPEGGYVVAVQDGANLYGIKQYLKQFKEKFPQKDPICFMRVPIFHEGKPLAVVYNHGDGEKKGLPKIELRKPSKAERLIDMIPDDVMALMLSTAFHQNGGKE